MTPAPATSADALAIEQLTLSYLRDGRALTVLRDVSLSIRSGEAYGLVGESGCGKSTVAMAVMRYLARNARVDAGRILFHGRDLLTASEDELRPLRGNRMAMVYQDPRSALNPSMTIGRQISEVYEFHRRMSRAKATRAAAQMLETVQLPDPSRILRRYPHELSGGQQQRIMFAMALATDPDLLVLDEPTTGLDTTVEAEVLDLVAHLRSRFGTSILFISHNLGIVARMCERVGVLYAGRLIEEGPSQALLSNPRHPYTLGLLRCVPQPGMRKDQFRLDPIVGSLPHLGHTPHGCVYAARCPIARPRCRQQAPGLEPAGEARLSRCFYHSEVPEIAPSAQARPEPAATAPEDQVLLKVDKLNKVYGGGGYRVTAVDEISFELPAGQVLGLVGESGSGKSTLAKCLVGLVEMTGGKVTLGGHDLVRRADWQTAALRRKLQMVFQNPDTALNPMHSVRYILRRAAKLLAPGSSRAETDERIEALAASVRLRPEHLDFKPSALSGGLKQRVAIARAFAGAPSLVLCDEPTSALDVSVQAAILNLLANLQAEKQVAYLFISHDLGVVRYLADRIAVIYLGQLVDVGTAESVFSPPHHPYTEALLSAMPIIDPEQRPSRIKLSGTVPNPANPPSGCRFHTRCPRIRGDICRTERPPWQTDRGHVYNCHIPPEELARMQATGGQAPSAAAPPARASGEPEGG